METVRVEVLSVESWTHSTCAQGKLLDVRVEVRRPISNVQRCTLQTGEVIGDW